MIISVTERGTFKRCPQMWDYESRNRQALTPLRTPTALNIGTMIHKAGEALLQDPYKNIDDHVLGVIQETLDAAAAQYKAAIGVEPEQSELDPILDQASLVLKMMQNYVEFYGSDMPAGYELVQTEQTLLLPVPNTLHPCSSCPQSWSSGVGYYIAPGTARPDCLECKGEGSVFHYLEATLDAVVKDANGYLWVYERKTYGQRPKLESLQMNDQFRAYTWALTQVGLGPVGGVLYDGMWKRDVEGKRRLEDLFTRTPIIFSPEELHSFERELTREAKVMYQAHTDPERIYRNFQWQGCWDCKVSSLCLAEYRGEDSDYIKQNNFTTRDKAPWLNVTEENEQ